MRQALKYVRELNITKILNFVFVIITFAISFYLMAGNSLIGNDPLGKIDFWTCLFVFIADFVCFLFLICLNSIRNKYRPSVPLIVGLIVIFATNFVTLIMFQETSHLQHTMPDGSINEIIYTLTIQDKLCYIFQFFGVLVVAYLIVDLIPKNIEGLSTIYLLCFAGFVFAFVSLIYSYLTEAGYYTTFFFKILHKDESFVHAKSFFPNKNSFAAVLFIGMVSCLFMQQRKGHWIWFIPATYLLFTILISFCKALIIIAPIFFLGFLLYRGILTIKHHVCRNLVTTFCVFAIIGCFALLVMYAEKAVPGFYDYLYKMYVKTGDDTPNSRIELWKCSIELLNKFSWITGIGFHNANYLLFQYAGLPTVVGGYSSVPVHNVGLEMLLSGGGFFALFFILALVMVFILLFRDFKQNKSIVLFELILVICLLGLGMVESGSFILSSTADYAFFAGLIFIPLVQIFHQRKLERIELEKDCLAY